MTQTDRSRTVCCFTLNLKLTFSENIFLRLFQYSLLLSVGLIAWLCTSTGFFAHRFLCLALFHSDFTYWSHAADQS